MSLKSRRICKCCGKEYEYCPHCGSHSDEMWRNLTDTKECLAVFNIVAAYNVGRATAEQVKKVLTENSINDYSTFNKGIVATLDKVFDTSRIDFPKAEESKIESPVLKKVEERVADVAPISTVAHQVQISPEDNVVPRKNRNGKKKYRRNTDIGL